MNERDNKLFPTCKLLGWFQCKDSSNLIHFLEPKPAEELKDGVFAVTLDVTEILDDGSECPAVVPEFVVELPENNELSGYILPLNDPPEFPVYYDSHGREHAEF